MRRPGYKFTRKRHPKRAIMATILGVISLVSFSTVVYISYVNQGVMVASPGMTGVLITLFSVVGFVLSGITIFEKERYLLFPVLGLILNIVSLGGVSILLYAAV